MDKFNRFLENNEELLLVIRKNNRNWQFYITVFIALPLAFFLLYPMGSQGRQGLFLWLALVVVLLITALKQLLKQKDCYLLTNRQIIHLSLENKTDYHQQGHIYLKKIDKIKKVGQHGICLFQQSKKFYLTNIQNRDKLWQKIVAVKTK